MDEWRSVTDNISVFYGGAVHPKQVQFFEFCRGFIINKDVFHDGNRNKIYDILDEMADFRERENRKIMYEWADD